MSVLLVKQRSSVFEPPFAVFRGNVCDSSLAHWKPCSRFLKVITEHSRSLALTAEALRRNRPLLKGCVNLRINIRSTDYVYRQHLYTVTWGNGFTFAARRFYTKRLCSRLYSIELEFLFTKTTNSLFEPPFGVTQIAYVISE